MLESRAGQRKCGKSMPVKSSILPADTDSLDPARIPAIFKVPYTIASFEVVFVRLLVLLFLFYKETRKEMESNLRYCYAQP